MSKNEYLCIYTYVYVCIRMYICVCVILCIFMYKFIFYCIYIIFFLICSYTHISCVCVYHLCVCVSRVCHACACHVCVCVTRVRVMCACVRHALVSYWCVCVMYGGYLRIRALWSKKKTNDVPYLCDRKGSFQKKKRPRFCQANDTIRNDAPQLCFKNRKYAIRYENK